jgi:hypothetical protein
MTKKLLMYMLMVTQTIIILILIDEDSRCSSCPVRSTGFCGDSNKLGDYVTMHADK